ncbi:MAG TPA: EAL domain-containing protein [Candidatus Elarobacter sp.]|nr:EAL domain-containing protein [Candidatus Elarobacter sp.]
MLGSAALVAFAAGSAPFAHRVLPHLGPVVPVVMVAAAVAQLATFAVLVALYARAPRRSTAVLALTFLTVAMVTVAQAGSISLVPGTEPVFRVAPQIAAWMDILRCLGFSAGALAYVLLRRGAERELQPRRARQFLTWAIAVAVTVTAVAIALAFPAGGPARLVYAGPAYVISPAVAGVLLLISAAVTVFVYRSRAHDAVDAGLMLAMLGLTLDVALTVLDARRFVGAWYTARVLYLGASTFVVAGAVSDLLRWRTRALHLETLLGEQLHRVENHSRRLETLWKLASQPALDDEAFLRAVLLESSSAIHPGREFVGVITHLDGTDAVVDINQNGSEIDEDLAVAARLPIADTLVAELLRTGHTCSWNDVHRHESIAHIRRVRSMPWKAFVGTPFRVGPTVYFLTFTSTAALVEQFSAEDHAYVEIVASFCASRLQQRVQFERLRHQSVHDPLTGLPNRVAFRVAGSRELANGEPLALAVVDVDRFRAVNETHGHQTADAVLVEIGAAIAARVADGDVVARLGGDTFGVLLRGAASGEDVERRVERIHTAFAEPFGTGDREGKQSVPVTASIGVAIAPQDGPGFERLLSRADAAVRTAKENGRARWSFFDRSVEDAFLRARRLQTDLAQALVREEFVLHFQPNVEIATGRVVGVEALIRWQHPERGLLSPADFVPFAEEHAMLGAIGAWVMRETVRASRVWRAEDPEFRAWFNVSALELNDPALVRNLNELGEDLRGIGVEITESIAMRDVQATMRTVAALREAGLAIALDDFGTGYSSFAHLKRLPIDVVKIDRTFTAGVPDDPHDAAIVEAVIGIATRYGFTTIAEGVETMGQAAYLLGAGCLHAQGYHYAQPMTAAAFSAYLRNARNSVRGAAYMRA